MEQTQSSDSDLSGLLWRKVRHGLYGNGMIIEVNQDSEEPTVLVVFAQSDDTGNAEYVDLAELGSGWDDTEASVSPEARELKQRLFGEGLTVDDLAYILDRDRTTILRYLREGTIVGYQVGREWRVDAAELERYKDRMLDERRTEADRHAKMAAVEAKRDLLRRTYPGKSWYAGICMSCLNPLLMEWNWDGEVEAYHGQCNQCNQWSSYVPPGAEGTATTGQGSETSEIDSMPF